MTENNFQLVIENKVIVFNRPIEQVIRLENRILVRFETSDNLFSNRYDLRVKKESNILCFDESGNLLWEIEEAPKLDSLGGPFGKMFLDNGKILTYHQMGCDFEIDLNSGKVKAKTQGRPW